MNFQNCFLHTDQAAVFVLVANVMEFIVETSQTINFFVTYEIMCEEMTVKMTLNAGDIDIDYEMICGSETEINTGKSESEKNLLLIFYDFISFHRFSL